VWVVNCLVRGDTKISGPMVVRFKPSDRAVAVEPTDDQYMDLPWNEASDIFGTDG
jgi:hypothetical protein